jgi:hypothetical protein
VRASQLRSCIDDLAQLDPGTLDEDVLRSELIGLRREIDRLEAVFARMAHTGDEKQIGAVDGAPSTAAWLRTRAEMREGDAKSAIAAGAACEVLEEFGEAWRAGNVSTVSARLVAAARVDGQDDLYRDYERFFLKHARHGDVKLVRKVCAQYRDEARAAAGIGHTPDTLTMGMTPRNRMVVHSELTGTGAEVVATALHAYVDPPSEDDDRTEAQRYAAAFVRIAEVALEYAPKGRRSRANVTYTLHTNHDGTIDRVVGAFTGPIPREQLERLLCDCTVSRVVLGPDSRPLDVGRAQRTPPPSMRRAVIARDDGCRYPGCNRPPGWTDAHHVKHWTKDGITATDNLVLLCDHHHTVVHQPGWHATFDGIDVHVFRPEGTEVLATPPRAAIASPRADQRPARTRTLTTA